MKGKLCSLKSASLSLLFVFLCLFLLLSHPLTASAASVQISSFGVSALQPNGSAYSVIENVYYNQYISFNGVPPEAIKLYRFDTDVLAVSGNYANIHFETNIVFSQPTSLAYIANFVNRGYISVLRCSTSDGASLVINSSSVSSHVTEWTGPAPVINGKNKTLTVYGDVTVSGLTSGNKRISCAVGSDTYAIYQTSSPTNLPNVYIEQQPTSIDFTNNQSEALLNTQIEQNNTIINNQENINNSINDIEDSITDPTVEGDFTMPEIPAFGPIATIINNIISIPQSFYNAFNRSCQPLTGGPLPFTNQNITLPCFLPLMQSLGLNTVVGTLQNILAMYIWVRIAIFIVRSVKKLRDPQNDDEEYLDL